jgi:hypothetical protein
VFWWTTDLQVNQVAFLCHNPSLVYHVLATRDILARHVRQSYPHLPSFPFSIPFILRCLQHTRCGCSVLNLGLSLNTHPRQFSSLVIILSRFKELSLQVIQQDQTPSYLPLSMSYSTKSRSMNPLTSIVSPPVV